jgi:uncharacterized membrane protein
MDVNFIYKKSTLMNSHIRLRRETLSSAPVLITSLTSVVRREGGLVRLPSPVVFFVSPMVYSMGMGVVLPAVLAVEFVFSESYGLWSFVFICVWFLLSSRLLWQEVLPEASGGVHLFSFFVSPMEGISA